MALSSSSHQAIDDLVKLLVSSSLFSRESEIEWAKGFNEEETKGMTKDEHGSKKLEDYHCRLITDMGNKIFPSWNEEDDKQKVLDDALSTALLWVARSQDMIDSTPVTYLELNDHVRTLFLGRYMEFDDAKKIEYKKCKEIPVFVDFENCRIIPDGKDLSYYNVDKFVDNIKASLKMYGYDAEGLDVRVIAVGKTRSFHADRRIATFITQSLANQNVIYHHATTGLPDTADKRMIASIISYMHSYLRKHNEGGVVVICTSDVDFLGTIMELKKHNFYVIIAHNENEANPKLTGAPHKRLLWHKFIEEKDSKKV